jgi:hypothetical protein
MTEPEIDYGERLRRALHAAGDSVVPSGDGLDRIRHRIAHEQSRDPLSLGRLVRWLQFAVLERFAPVGGWRWPVLSQGWWRPRLPHGRNPLALVAGLRRLRLAEAVWRLGVPGWSRLRLPDGSPRFTVPAALRRATIPENLRGLALFDGLRRLTSDGLRAFSGGLSRLKMPDAIRRAALPGGWMRPVLATTGAVIVAVVAVLAIPALRQSVIPTGANSTPGPGSAQKGQGTVTGHGGTGPVTIPPVMSSNPQASPSSTGSRSSSPAPTKCAHSAGTVSPATSASSPSPAATCTPTPGSSASPTPTPTMTTPTPTPTLTPTPTPTPTDTSSSVPQSQTSGATDPGSASP